MKTLQIYFLLLFFIAGVPILKAKNLLTNQDYCTSFGFNASSTYTAKTVAMETTFTDFISGCVAFYYIPIPSYDNLQILVEITFHETPDFFPPFIVTTTANQVPSAYLDAEGYITPTVGKISGMKHFYNSDLYTFFHFGPFNSTNPLPNNGVYFGIYQYSNGSSLYVPKTVPVNITVTTSGSTALCAKNCSNNGVCKNGKCACNNAATVIYLDSYCHKTGLNASSLDGSQLTLKKEIVYQVDSANLTYPTVTLRVVGDFTSSITLWAYPTVISETKHNQLPQYIPQLFMIFMDHELSAPHVSFTLGYNSDNILSPAGGEADWDIHLIIVNMGSKPMTISLKIDKPEDNTFPVWSIILIVISGVVLVAVIILALVLTIKERSSKALKEKYANEKVQYQEVVQSPSGSQLHKELQIQSSQ